METAKTEDLFRLHGLSVLLFSIFVPVNAEVRFICVSSHHCDFFHNQSSHDCLTHTINLLVLIDINLLILICSNSVLVQVILPTLDWSKKGHDHSLHCWSNNTMARKLFVDCLCAFQFDHSSQEC